MKPFFLSAVALIATLLLPGCHLKRTYACNEAARVAYLNEKSTGPARVSLEGVWYSPEWGIFVLKQSEDGKLKGMSNDYMEVEGVVVGKKAYLTFVDSGWTEYTVELERTSYDKLKGMFSAFVPFNKADQEEIVLEKIRL